MAAGTLTPAQLQRKYQISAKKSLGQNFLADPNHLRKIVETATLKADDIVLEIGPGLGALTQPLLAQAGHVVAVEADVALANILQTELQSSNFSLIQGDILTLAVATVLQQQVPHFSPGDDYKVVANLPYYITSAIIRHLLSGTFPPQTMVITLQKEVAQRITAQPGKLSLLAVSVQFYGRPTYCHTIPANAFKPAPKVDSAVLKIERHLQPPVEVDDPRRYFRVVKAGFSQKRKQLKNSLGSGLGIGTKQAADLLQTAGIDPRRRAETLSLTEWGAVNNAYAALNA